MDTLLHASTSNLLRFTLKHATTGQGLTGLSSASSGLIISTIADNEAAPTVYTVAAGNIEGISALGTFATPTASKCRLKEVDATNHKGLYEFQFADARFSVASAKKLIISVTGATNLLDADYQIQLTRYDPYAALATPTNITTVATTTNLTNLPSIPANWLTAAGIAATALNGKGDWNIGKTGYSLTQAFPTNFASLSISAGGLVDILQSAADKVWSTTTRAITDKAGFALSSAGVQAIWDALTSALTTVGSIGKFLVDNITSTITHLTDIKGTGFVKDTHSLTNVEGFVDDLETTIGIAGAGLTDLGGMSTTMKAQAKAEVNAALDTAIPELGVGVPAATPTIRTAQMLLYMAVRNQVKVQTSGTDALEIYNDAGTLITKKLITDDTVDYTEAKLS